MNILIIDVDALRPDHLGAYGYDVGTPHIDAVAEDGVVFTNAYTSDSPSLPSRAALVTGRYGISNGVVTHGPDAYTINSPHTWASYDRFRQDYWTLPELFFNERVRTGAVAPDGRHPAPWFYHVWHEYIQPQEPRGEQEWFMTVRGSTVVDEATGFMERHAADNFFLYTQFWDVHAPSRIPNTVEPVTPSKVSPPPYPTDEQIAAHQTWNASRCSSDTPVKDREELKALLADYTTAVRYVDQQVGRLITWLKDHGRYDDTLIVITADHGEEFGEHGVYRDHWSTYDGTQRIPLIIKPPAGSASSTGRRDQLVTNVDIAPTLADYAGIDAPRSWHGRSLQPLIKDKRASWRDHIVLGHGLYTAQRAVRTADWKMIRTYHPGTWGNILPEIQLFNVSNDSWEQHDVSGDNDELVQDLSLKMKRFVDDHVGRDGDPLMQVAQDGPIGSMGRQANVAAWRWHQ